MVPAGVGNQILQIITLNNSISLHRRSSVPNDRSIGLPPCDEGLSPECRTRSCFCLCLRLTEGSLIGCSEIIDI